MKIMVSWQIYSNNIQKSQLSRWIWILMSMNERLRIKRLFNSEIEAENKISWSDETFLTSILCSCCWTTKNPRVFSRIWEFKIFGVVRSDDILSLNDFMPPKKQDYFDFSKQISLSTFYILHFDVERKNSNST